MRKTTMMLLTAATLIGVMVVSSGNAAVLQEEHGVLVNPSPGRVAGVYVEGCRGVTGVTVEWIAGVSIHPSFAVKSSTWGSSFTVVPAKTAGRYLANIDITFVGTLGSVRHAATRLGGEAGTVPSGASRAFVCLSYGTPTKFTYRAGF